MSIKDLPVIPINASDRSFAKNRFILYFGDAYGPGTVLMAWANHLEGALNECVDWLAENAPGRLITDVVAEEYQRLVAEGKSEEEAMEEATVDTTCAGNCGHYLDSEEWSIVYENPSRAQVLDLIKQRKR